MNKYEAIRAEIKKLSEEQRLYKPLRKKYVIISDENGLTATKENILVGKASYIVWINKKTLRHLFQAYAILKGKDRPIITKPDHEISERIVQDMVEKYRPLEVLEVLEEI